jgi:hypothetical protein
MKRCEEFGGSVMSEDPKRLPKCLAAERTQTVSVEDLRGVVEKSMDYALDWDKHPTHVENNDDYYQGVAKVVKELEQLLAKSEGEG